MKILKILFILLIPAVSIVGCRKAALKPAATNPASPASVSTTNVQSSESGARSIETSSVDEIKKGSDIVGSGDDDRDGGDKRKKAVK